MSRSPQAQTADPAHANDGVLAVGIGARVALLAGVVGLAAAGAMVLRSGPESDHAAVPVASENARLIAESRVPERKSPEIIEMARGTYFSLAGWMHEYERGAIVIGGSVSGDDLALVGGSINVGGTVVGDVTLAASGNEDTYVSLGAYGRTLENFNDWRDPEVFGPDDYTESQRYGQRQPEEVIRVGGQIGEDVTMMRATHWFEARQEAINPAPAIPLGTPAPLNVDLPDGTAVDGALQRRPIP